MLDCSFGCHCHHWGSEWENFVWREYTCLFRWGPQGPIKSSSTHILPFGAAVDTFEWDEQTVAEHPGADAVTNGEVKKTVAFLGRPTTLADYGCSQCGRAG